MSRFETAWVRFGWRSAALAALLAGVLGLAGCGGGSGGSGAGGSAAGGSGGSGASGAGAAGSGTGASASDGIKTSVGKYVTALADHDATSACNVVTTAYWSATATELVTQLNTKQYGNLPSETCQQGLKRIFSGSKAAGSVPKFAVSNIKVEGRTAIAHLTLGRATSDGTVANSRFVKAPSGVWQIDCCTGSQLAKHPPNLPG